MKFRLFVLCILLTALAGPAAAATGSTTDDAAARIAVTTMRMDPAVLMRGDTGILTVKITNTGDDNVAIGRAKILSQEIAVLNEYTYDVVGTIGGGNSMEFTFSLKANVPDGMYYPVFYLDFRDSGSLRQVVPVRVDNTSVRVTVLDAPDVFSAGNADEVTLSVGNPRPYNVTGVTVVPSGEGITSTQSAVFLGALGPDEVRTVTFDVTPLAATTLLFDVAYRNGMNEHHAGITLPVSIGTRSMEAEPVVNNMKVVQEGGQYTVTGDVTNAGLKDAKSIVVTVGTPAQPLEPNRLYVIGALEPDDFSSFEVNFAAPGASSVPLVIQYKDEKGNARETTVPVALTSGGQATRSNAGTGIQVSGTPPGGGRGPGMFGSFGSGLNQIPFLQIAVAIVAAIALIIAWRKGFLGKIRARFRR
jgi:hypothetical protein